MSNFKSVRSIPDVLVAVTARQFASAMFGFGDFISSMLPGTSEATPPEVTESPLFAKHSATVIVGSVPQVPSQNKKDFVPDVSVSWRVAC
jgi:hypothetical protein